MDKVHVEVSVSKVHSQFLWLRSGWLGCPRMHLAMARRGRLETGTLEAVAMDAHDAMAQDQRAGLVGGVDTNEEVLVEVG